MTERRQIVRAWRAGGLAAMITLVKVEGSSYRREGARLVVKQVATNDEMYVGSISGGCLEAELVRKAAWKIQGGATVERFAMSFDDTAEIPFGLGCGGTVEVLIEPVDSAEAHAVFQAMEASLNGSESTIVSFLPGGGRGLRRLVLGMEGQILFRSPGLSDEKVACASRLSPGGEHDGRFVERLEAPQRLLVLGAGEDARPLVKMAAMLGWTVIVADGRVQLARAERFAEAAQVIGTSDEASVAIGSLDAVVVMTHSYEQDRRWLMAAMRKGPRYLGVLGSRHRSSVLVKECADRLGLPLEQACEGVFAPVGLDLGGDGAEAIALAIVSEVQALVHGRLGHSRRLTPEEVELQLEAGGSSQYLEQQCALEETGV